jgi:peptide/nickel transport system permease protein
MRYLLGRLIQSVILILIVATVVFFIVRLTGDPRNTLLDPKATIEDRELVAQNLGLDKPLAVQYGIFLINLAHGDFGKSFTSQEPCLKLFFQFFPNTLELTVLSMLLSLVIALPIGVYAARKKGSIFDALSRAFAFMGQAAPIFWTGILGILLFSVKMHLLPAGGMGGFSNLILPTVTLGWVMASGLLRLTRSSMIDVLNSDYIKMARAKGMSEMVVLWKHGIKNAALPILTFFILLFVGLIGSAIVTETVFSWPGVGRMMMAAVLNRDFPLVQCVVILLCIFYIAANFLVDIFYMLLNPKIRYQ